MRQWRPTGEELSLIGAIARHAGISAAARALARPKQTLSRQLAQIERTAGGPLFDRMGGRLRPTPLLKALLPHAQAVLAAEAAAVLALARHRGAPSGKLTVRAQAVFAQGIVAPAIGNLLAKHPALTVELRVENARVEPIADDLDVAITLGRPIQAELKIRLIARLAAGLYAPTGLVLAAAPKRSDISVIPRVVYGAEATQPWVLTRKGEEWFLDQPAIALVNEPQAALELLMHAKQACGLLPRFMAEPMVRLGRLRALAPDWAGRDVRIYFATPPGRSQLPAVKALAAEMEDVMHRSPDWAI